jgi:hypothetical protein
MTVTSEIEKTSSDVYMLNMQGREREREEIKEEERTRNGPRADGRSHYFISEISFQILLRSVSLFETGRVGVRFTI